MRNDVHVPVLIVGGGPVGLALALDLGWRGVKALLVERGIGVPVHPRAAAIPVRTMEFCRRWGIASKVRNAGFPPDYPFNVVYCTGLDGYTLAIQRFPSMQDRKPIPQSPEMRERCPQIWFDPILEDALSAYPHVELRRPCLMESFVDRGDLVEVTLLDMETDIRSTVTCDYFVACDGTSSQVRRTLGVASSGKGLLTNSINAVLEIPGFLQRHDKGPAERYLFLDSRGTWANLTVIDGCTRWRFTYTGSEETVDRDSIDLATTIRKALGPDMPFEVVAVAPWRRLELMADRFRVGRVILAGDSAHTIPPNLGLGMNTGVADAVDLGWKLEATLNGWAGPHLLDSYEAERRPAAIRNATASSKTFGLWMASSDAHHNLLAPGERGVKARADVGAFLTGALPEGWDTLGLQLGYRYDDSPICVADGTPQPPPDPPGVYHATGRPGARAPHFWLSDERSSLDLFGRSFVLFRFGNPSLNVENLREAARERGVPLDVTDVDDPAAATLYGGTLVLVRPDGHVAWRSEELRGDAGALIDHVRGAGQPATSATTPTAVRSGGLAGTAP